MHEYTEHWKSPRAAPTSTPFGIACHAQKVSPARSPGSTTSGSKWRGKRESLRLKPDEEKRRKWIHSFMPHRKRHHEATCLGIRGSPQDNKPMQVTRDAAPLPTGVLFIIYVMPSVCTADVQRVQHRSGLCFKALTTCWRTQGNNRGSDLGKWNKGRKENVKLIDM